MAILVGKAVIWGIQEPKPLINLPSGARVKLRMRANDVAKAIVRYPDRVEQWVVVPSDNVLSAPTWELGWMTGCNVAQPQLACRTVE